MGSPAPPWARVLSGTTAAGLHVCKPHRSAEPAPSTGHKDQKGAAVLYSPISRRSELKVLLCPTVRPPNWWKRQGPMKRDPGGASVGGKGGGSRRVRGWGPSLHLKDVRTS